MAEKQYGDFLYVETFYQVIRITKYIGTDSIVTVPDQIEGILVGEIQQTFMNCECLEQVILPETLEGIGDYAFCGCKNLKQIQIPKHLEYIGDGAFQNCTQLKNLLLPDHLRIRHSAFRGCKNLHDDQGLFIVNEKQLFHYYGRSETVQIPEGVTHIMHSSFLKNKKLKTVTLPSTLQEIGYSAFEKCDKLEEIILPDSVKVIGYRAFALCKGLKKVVLSKGLQEVESETFARCSKLEEIVWSNQIKAIGSDAFTHCTSLKSMVFPSELVSVHRKAFCNCTSLTELYFPSSVNKIATKAFFSCNVLDKIIFAHTKGQEKKVKIAKNSFPYRENMLHVSNVVMKAWTQEEQERFRLKKLQSYEELTKEEQNEYKESLSRSAMRKLLFEQCGVEEIALYFQLGLDLKLSELDTYLTYSIERERTESTAILLNYKNEKFTKEEREEFEDNKELVEIGLEYPSYGQLSQNWNVIAGKDSITIIGYKGTNEMETIPSRLQTGKPILSLKKSPSKDFSPLKHLILSEGIEEILQGTFEWSCLETIELPSTLKVIEKFTFYNCVNLQEIILPTGLEQLGEGAFISCQNLKRVILSKNSMSIHENTFVNCRSLEFVGTENGENMIGQFRIK
ncbi:MAG: leucine-rich repeat domain-containing protein [Eubacteriales bacterium]